ncbi:hypothetical protein DY000_02036691 [Brassica cretica]|uniref:NB-ARC domain-containing protein n=1 Tax=Brassica cretica TaxID=69181 RepID=A0ABQ7BBC2_BRACR|nr:hypothetical protein DY000_02036691 [Brassica cretica]
MISYDGGVKTKKLVILDDVWTREALDHLTSNLPGCTTLVVSRSKLADPSATYDVEVLREYEAISLFCLCAFGQKSVPPGFDKDLVKKVAGECKGLPLALKSRRSRECFLDLGAFPKDRKIPVDVLINMWTEMHDLDEEVAFATLVGLSHKNLLTLEEDPRLGSLYASYYDVFVTHHDVLPETWQFIWEMGDMHWSNFDMDFPKAEILILNFSSDKYVLPPFLSKMIRLRFLVIINNGMSPAVLHNLSVFANLSKLKSLWLERVHVPELYNTTIPMKHLHKMSLILCKINNSFDQTGVDVSSIFPKLGDLTIDHCDDLVTLPSSICKMTSLNSLSITNCPRLGELPKTLSKLQALELLRLHACHELKALPVEICELLQLKYLDISQCVSLICLPEDIGKLKMLEKIDMRECYISSKVRSAVSLESLRHVNCDKDVAFIWEDVEKAVPGLRIESC